MGFDEQTLINYLNQIILPFIDNTPSVDDVKNITEWLANNWEELIHDLDEVPKNDLIVKLAKSQIVIDSDNVLDTAESYYHPDFFSDLPKILQDEQYLPFKFEDASTQKKWSDLLVVLGASKKIIPKHIVSTVQSIVLDDDAKKSIGLINYISNHFESFKEMKFGNKNIFWAQISVF